MGGLRSDVNAAVGGAMSALSVYDGDTSGIRTDVSPMCWGDDDALVADAPDGVCTEAARGGGPPRARWARTPG